MSLRRFLLATAAAASIFVVVAIGLAILGIAQAGNGGTAWTDQLAISRGAVQLAVADVVALAAAALAGFGAFIASR